MKKMRAINLEIYAGLQIPGNPFSPIGFLKLPVKVLYPVRQKDKSATLIFSN